MAASGLDTLQRGYQGIDLFAGVVECQRRAHRALNAHTAQNVWLGRSGGRNVRRFLPG